MRCNTLISSKQGYGFHALQISAVLLGFSVPISVAMDNVLLVIVLLGALLNVHAVWNMAKENPLARAAWLLFLALFVAMFYGSPSVSDSLGALGKYADLAFIPMFMLLFNNEIWRKRAVYAFLGAMGLTLLLSYLVALKLLPIQHWMTPYAVIDNPVIFHSHIAQNNMMALAAFLALLQCRDALTSRIRFVWGLFAVLAMANILFMVQGRTGYIILLAQLCWFAWSSLTRYFYLRGKVWGWRQGLMLLAASVVLVGAAYVSSERLHDRVSMVKSEFHEWQPNHGKDTSTGQRLDFYYNTLQIVQQHPLLGVGTGGFPSAFAKQIAGNGAPLTVNPHNEFLLITVQTGLGGLVLLLYLFYMHWHCALKLSTAFEQDAARGLLLMYLINCALNSALYDHVDGLLFAFMTAIFFSGYRCKVVKHE